MKQFLKISAVVLSMLLFLASCVGGGSHFLTDKAYRDKVHEDFLKRKEVASHRSEQLFSVFNKEGLTAEQREALEFLYAYMPLGDLGEYDGEFFLGQVDGAFRARDFFSWGKSVPEDIFRHFVLVHRVNNEYMDDARNVFFEELKDRIKDMSMRDAALEVNHWCHEKVTYRGTDGRTMSPLALVMTSWGRCGEESAFTTAAMRSVGIPARQCYTPRWVHTDDNHAWVEVWIDGKWYYMGACEPEPELNVAWFDGPVQRAMMVHTTVYGLYNGPEEKNTVTDLYSTINLLGNYAPTRTINVKVVDEAGQPVEGANVRFKVYNYSDLYPMSRMDSDAEGNAKVMTGMGDAVVWASKDGKYGYVKSSKNDDNITLTLNRTAGENYEESFVMEPPVEQPFRELPADLVAANTVRLTYEDSLRNAYMATFVDEAYAEKLAESTGLDKGRVWRSLNASQGNWREISSFIEVNSENPHLFPFLRSLLDKDLRDTPQAYLNDHLRNSTVFAEGTPENLIASNVMSPRIALELIKPWRSYFQNEVHQVNPELKTVNGIIEYIRENIEVSDWQNYYNCRITPQAVHELKVADGSSRDIYFVALCRAAGIPARLEQATRKPQYYENGAWNDVAFEDNSTAVADPRGVLTLLNDPENIIVPGYESHFTVAHFRDGDFRVLSLGSEVRRFPATLKLDEGYYRVMIGSRANDGSVTVDTKYFELRDGEPHTVTITMPKVEGKLFVKGIVDMNSIIVLGDGTKTTLKKLSAGKGVMLCFADPGKEPTKHILQDLPSQKQALDQWGGGVLFMVPDDKVNAAFSPDQFNGLPERTVWSVDNGRALLNATAGALQMQFSNNFPLVVYLSNNGGILFSSQGYRIGIGEDIISTIRMEQDVLSKQE